MDELGSDNNLSYSLQTTLALGSAVALVVGVILHRNRDLFSSLFIKSIGDENMKQRIDWQNQTISAQVCNTIIVFRISNATLLIHKHEKKFVETR